MKNYQISNQYHCEKKKERHKGQSKLSESKLLRETLRQLFINKLNYFYEICHKNSKQEWCYSERWLYEDNNSLPHSQFLLIFRLDKDLHALISLNWKQLMKYGRMCFLLFLFKKNRFHFCLFGRNLHFWPI